MYLIVLFFTRNSKEPLNEFFEAFKFFIDFNFGKFSKVLKSQLTIVNYIIY